MIVDGGPCPMGMESTVLDVTVCPPMMLRPGGVTREMLEAVIGPISLDPSLSGTSGKPKAPGMKYAHYAPRAPLILYTGTPEDVTARIAAEAAALHVAGKNVGLLCTEESIDTYARIFAEKPGHERILPLSAGCRARPGTIAAGVFATLRQFDVLGVDVILAEGFPETGVGHAIMNRLKKAAGGHVVNC